MEEAVDKWMADSVWERIRDVVESLCYERKREGEDAGSD